MDVEELARIMNQVLVILRAHELNFTMLKDTVESLEKKQNVLMAQINDISAKHQEYARTMQSINKHFDLDRRRDSVIHHQLNTANTELNILRKDVFEATKILQSLLEDTSNMHTKLDSLPCSDFHNLVFPYDE